MLAGLIFAVQDADDRPGTLAATLPFAGLTVIEYQARLLIDAGASQIVVVVARLTPELLGAVARIGRRGVTVDAVRTAAEASAKLHPLARLLVLAEGLVTTEPVIAPLANEGRDTLLVVTDEDASGGFERIGGGWLWAGAARLDARRLSEVAAMPRDYDVQSALLHAAGQAGAAHLPLSDAEARAGHGIERRGAALDERSRAVMAATIAARPGWFDRWIVRPLGRVALPHVLRRAVPGAAVATGAGALALSGWIGIAASYETLGLALTLAGVTLASLGSAYAWLRDEAGLSRTLTIGASVAPAVAALLLGRAVDLTAGGATAEVVAVALISAVALGERAITGLARPIWWGSPPGYLLIVTLMTVLGAPTLGLSIAALYALATLAAAIETLKRGV